MEHNDWMCWPREKFDALPQVDHGDDLSGIDSLIIMPHDGQELHDSGFAFMSVAIIKDNKPIAKTPICSDVLHLGGIFGDNRKTWTAGSKAAPAAWNIDCLPVSKLLRVFNGKGKIDLGMPLSSLEIVGVEDKE